jgi:hypothetical protein
MKKTNFQTAEKIKEIVERVEAFHGMKAMKGYQVDEIIFW